MKFKIVDEVPRCESFRSPGGRVRCELPAEPGAHKLMHTATLAGDMTYHCGRD